MTSLLVINHLHEVFAIDYIYYVIGHTLNPTEKEILQSVFSTGHDSEFV